MRNEKGLSLIELLATMVILAIVASIAIYSIGNVIDNTRGRALKAEAVNFFQAARIHITENSPSTFNNTQLTLQNLKDSEHFATEAGLTSATITIDANGNQTLEAEGQKGRITLEVKEGTTYEMLLQHDGKPNEDGEVIIGP